MVSVLLLWILLFCHLGEASSSKPPEQNKASVSLEQDRAELDQLRSDVPEDIKSDNDDLAFVLKLFDDPNRRPESIRREFNKVISRRRKHQQRRFKKERKAYTKKEKSARKKFLAGAKTKRKKFLSTQHEKDAKKEFFENERAERKAFFADERENRRDFESDVRSRQREFDAFLRDKRKQFEDRFRQFKRDQKERKKREKAAMKSRRRSGGKAKNTELSPEHQAYLKDFEAIPRKPGLLLAPTKEQ